MRQAVILIMSSIMSVAGAGTALGVAAPADRLAASETAPADAPLPEDVNSCILCHTVAEFFDPDQQQFVVSTDQLQHDTHRNHGIRCHNCHGGNPTALDRDSAHATTVAENQVGIRPFRTRGELQHICATCHQEIDAALRESTHGLAAKNPKKTDPRPLHCNACHGASPHGIRAVNDRQSPVFRANQLAECGHCHDTQLREYNASIHGHGVREAGLLVAAVCADCHSAHHILPAADPRSTLHETQVATTCAKCHRFIEERLRKSVHGRGSGLGNAVQKAAPGGSVKRRPSCTDCHAGHDLPSPNSPAFRLTLADRCGNCHTQLHDTYNISMHGALSDLGHVRGAKCPDCHGAHDILPLDNPRGRLAAGTNRLNTCRQCHSNATPNFCEFLPHADFREADDGHFILHAIFVGMELLIYSVFAFFGLHSILWFGRSLVHVLRHGRPRKLAPGQVAYVRFAGIHRTLHAVVATSFLGLALTGLPIRYSSQTWAKNVARALGGFESTSVWHHICGVITILYFVSHLVWLGRRIWIKRRHHTPWLTIVFGPDSPMPNLRDVVDITRMFRWFVGRGPKPSFERWTYWEKFDYWAVFWGVGIIGTSGLILWFPNVFCHFLPGITLNIAKIVHSEEALLATSFIFAIHFFGTHLRPEKFPMDLSVLSGLVTSEEMWEERSEYYERLQRESKLEALQSVVPTRRQLVLIMVAGFCALFVGLALLAGILVAMLSG